MSEFIRGARQLRDSARHQLHILRQYLASLYGIYSVRQCEISALDYLPKHLDAYAAEMDRLIELAFNQASTGIGSKAHELEWGGVFPPQSAKHSIYPAFKETRVRTIAFELLSEHLQHELQRDFRLAETPPACVSDDLDDRLLQINRHATVLVISGARMLQVSLEYCSTQAEIVWDSQLAAAFERGVGSLEFFTDRGLLFLDSDYDYYPLQAQELLLEMHDAAQELERLLPQLFVNRSLWTSASRKSESSLAAMLQDTSFWRNVFLSVYFTTVDFVDFLRDRPTDAGSR